MHGLRNLMSRNAVRLSRFIRYIFLWHMVPAILSPTKLLVFRFMESLIVLVLIPTLSLDMMQICITYQEMNAIVFCPI